MYASITRIFSFQLSFVGATERIKSKSVLNVFAFTGVFTCLTSGRCVDAQYDHVDTRSTPFNFI